MRDYEESVKRLREAARFSESRGYSGMANTTEEAADAIEELIVQQRGNEEAVKVMQMEIDRLLASRTPKWIPVTERLPFAESGDVSQKVLVTDGQDMAIAELFNFEICEPYWSYTGIGEVTHWMPLPEPPKEEK